MGICLKFLSAFQGYFELSGALAAAKSTKKKPLLIDFTDTGCVNAARWKEKCVWSDPQVLA